MTSARDPAGWNQKPVNASMLQSLASGMIPAALAFITLATVASAAPTSNILEKKLSVPSPVQWKSGVVEVSLVALAWGPANSPEMISEGREKHPAEKPEFFPDRSCALALGFRARTLGLVPTEMYACSGLVRIKNVEGDLEGPLELTPSGFVPFSGFPPCIYDLLFRKSNTTEYWDFFPASPNQREFLFEAFPSSGVVDRANNPALSFRIILKDNDFVIVTTAPGTQTQCLDFTRNFAGTVGSTSKVNLQLTGKGTSLSGTREYVRIGKTLWLRGQVDSFGNFVLEERYPKDRVTGIFKGRFSEGCRRMTGYFSKPDGSRLQPFEFQAVKGGN